MTAARPRVTIEDVLLVLFLTLTIWHSQHILAAYEETGFDWLAWPLAIGVDTGIAYAAWVASNATMRREARTIAAALMTFLLGISYGLNTAFYSKHGGDLWAWGLAAIFPLSLAAIGGIRAYRYSSEQPVQPAGHTAPTDNKVTDHVPPSTQMVTIASAADGGGDHDEQETLVAALRTEQEWPYDSFDDAVKAVAHKKVSNADVARHYKVDPSTVSRKVAKIKE